MHIMIAILIIGTAGSFLQIGGTSWDITSHIMQEPETFFTPSHTVLYTGVGLLTIAAGFSGVLLLRNNELRKLRRFSLFYLLAFVIKFFNVLFAIKQWTRHFWGCT